MNEPTRLFPTNFDAPLGPPVCVDCGEAIVERHRGTCAPCLQRRIERERSDGLRAAWATVPAFMRDGEHPVSFATIARWCRDPAAIEAARGAVGVPIVTLVGKAGAGKTSLAVAMLRERMRPGARLDAKPAEVWFARRARFVVGVDLLAAAAEHPRGRGRAPMVQAAHRASVLVLDELVADRDEVLFGLLHERHREGRPTIVTTALTREQVGESSYGGGIERRLFDDACVIEVRKAASQ